MSASLRTLTSWLLHRPARSTSSSLCLENNKIAVEEIKRIAGRLDVVIANAGVSFGYMSSMDTPLQDVQDHFTVNVVGPLALFQATYLLIKASTSTPKFVPMSSTMGNIEKGSQMPTFQMPYRTSKAALNWLTAKLRSEHQDLGAHRWCSAFFHVTDDSHLQSPFLYDRDHWTPTWLALHWRVTL
jgi:NADP-dependent 3-hydroxy acid dehydrogenase YdfG